LLAQTESGTTIKISDFGLSKIMKPSDVMITACGTPGYVAPEVLKKKGYGPQVDLWSIGVITYILLVGYPPFFDANNPELFKKILAGRFKFDKPWWDHISNTGIVIITQAKDFVCKLLVVDPNRRMTVFEALKHPFINEETISEPLKLYHTLPQPNRNPRVRTNIKPPVKVY
jgi:calcium/calmodulin-dependent protein kinase I